MKCLTSLSRNAFVIVLLCFVCTSCGVFKPIGKELAEGALEATHDKAPSAIDAILARAGSTLRDSVLDGRTRAQIDAMIDGVTMKLQTRVVALRDSLMGQQLRTLVSDLTYTLLGDTTEMRIARLRNQLLGAETKRLVAVLRDEVLGGDTRALIADLRNELLGDSTSVAIAAIRDELLGPTTRDAVREIVDSAMAGVVKSYRNELSPGLRDDIGFVQKNAIWLLVALGAIAIVVILVIYHQKRQVEKTLGVVTVQIDQIPDRDLYDELTQRIKKKAVETGLEPVLRKQLANQGIN